MYTYYTSEKALARRTNRFVLVFILLGLPVMIVFSAIMFDESIQDASAISSVAFLLMWVATRVGIGRGTNEMTLIIGDESIVYRCGDHETILPWKAIARVGIVESPTGAPVRIKLCSADLGTLDLYAFEDQQGIVDRIKDRLPSDATIIRKRWLSNWRNPFVLAGVCWPIGCAVLYVVVSIMERLLRRLIPEGRIKKLGEK